MTPEEKRAAYRADITFGTNNEFGFDYLRDNMVLYPEQIVQRELEFRHRGRSGQHPDRRSPDAPDHQRAGQQGDGPLLQGGLSWFAG